MATFNYRAKAIDGSITKNTIEVTDEESLRRQLREEGLFLLSCREVKEKTREIVLSSGELSYFCRQLGVLLSSGIPLLRVFEIIMRGDMNADSLRVYKSIYNSLQGGLPLSLAMEREKGAFPEMLIKVIAAAEVKGSLAQSVSKMAAYYDKRQRVDARLRNAALYPLILIAVAFLSMIVLFALVVPEFYNIFAGLSLPWNTKLLFALSLAFVDYWYLFLLAAAVIVALAAYLLTRPGFRLVFDSWKVKLPWLGREMRIIYSDRFAESLNLLYSSGLTTAESLRISGSVLGNVFIASQVSEAAEQLHSGKNLSIALSAIKSLDSKVMAALSIGEETGRMEEMLSCAAESFSFDGDMALRRLTGILEPILIILLALFIALLLFSVILPVYSL